VQRTTGEKVGAIAGMLLPGIGTPIEQAIQDHYTNRVNQVKMYHQGATALGSALAAGPMGPDGKPTGIDPTTGQPMTPERKAQVQAQYEEAWTRYTEAAGVDKKTKDMLKKSKMMTDHLVGGGHNIPYPGGAAAPASGAGLGASGAAAPPNGAPPPPPGAPTPGMSLANVEASNAEQQKLRVGGQEAQFAREKSAADIQSDIATKRKIVIDSGGDPNSPLSMRYIYGTMMGGNFAGKVVRLPDGTIAPALQDPKLGGQYLDPQTYQPLVGAIEVPKYAALDKRTGIEYQETPTGPKLRGWQDPITHKFYAADSTTEIAEPKTWNPALTPTVHTAESINPVTGEKQTLTSTTRKGVPGPPPSPATSIPKSSGPAAKAASSIPAPAGTPKKSEADLSREDAYFIKAHPEIKKAYDTFNQSQERYNVMQSSLDPAIKKHDQQAMLNLLSNHLGMTMGLQKGTRMNQALIEDAEKSRPWLQGMETKFDKDGYLTGVTLSEPQMHSMLDLAKARLLEDKAAFERERAEAKANYGIRGTAPVSESGASGVGGGRGSAAAPKTAEEYLQSLTNGPK
jgi:hypothetical protein